MEFKCFTRWGQLPENADRLFDEAARSSMFLSQTWFNVLIETGLETNQRLLLACVVEDNQVLAILPLMTDDSETAQALRHLYTSLYSVLIIDSRREDIIACLADGLRQLPYRAFRLEPIATHDENMQMFQQRMQTAGFDCSRFHRFYNWYHPVNEASIEKYMSLRPSRVSNTVTRKRRKLEREQQVQITLYQDKDISTALADYNQIYRASWKAHEQFDALLEKLVYSFAEKGWLRLAVLYINNKPAAAQLWLVVGQKANIFKLAYDESWKRYSPGSILIAYMMQQVIEVDRVEEIDFLRGNDTYKQEWMTQRRERCALYCLKSNRETPSESLPGKLKARLFKWLKAFGFNR